MEKIDMQQGSLEWHQARWGNVTGTSLKSVYGTQSVQDTLMFDLIAQRMTEPQIAEIDTPAVVRGQELEGVARQKVIEKTGLDFTETGLLVNDTISSFSISPDGIYEDDGVIKGGLEIKCPSSKKHVEYIIKNEIPRAYLYQVLAPFVMSDEIEFWTFASYDDRNYERPLFLKKMLREECENYLEEYRKNLREFLDKVEEKYLEVTF